MLAKVHSCQIVGLTTSIIDVEVDIGRGLYSFTVVGLPDKAVEEARDRISAAIKNSGFKPLQKGSRKIVASLAPADIKKEGPIFDLAIALSSLLATEDIVFNSKGKVFLGELSLNGDIRSIKGALMITQAAAEAGYSEIFLPKQNAKEAALVYDISVFGATSLREIIAHLNEKASERSLIQREQQTKIAYTNPLWHIDFSDIAGQEQAKRGLEIAAAGGHNVALFGPPGTGKTILAQSFPGILPPLSFNEVLEVTGIHSASGTSRGEIITTSPFRSPHHTASYVSLVGGGTWPRPGEITLAHRGVLFLDEFPELERRVIESLRQPLEDNIIHVSRARGSVVFPANFILIAAMNLCPCGNTGIPKKECVCRPSDNLRYRRKVSGPIADRIDMWLPAPYIEHKKLLDKQRLPSSGDIKKRVVGARILQRERFGKGGRISLNSQMNIKELKKFIPLATSVEQLLNEAGERLGLSARSYHKIIKIARTIADLAEDKSVGEKHVLEALQYRPKEL